MENLLDTPRRMTCQHVARNTISMGGVAQRAKTRGKEDNWKRKGDAYPPPFWEKGGGYALAPAQKPNFKKNEI